jgi:hypothetical protein
MRNTLKLTLAAVLLLGAAPALAANPFTDSEGITYPGTTTWTAVDSAPLVTSDVTYEGPRVTFAKSWSPSAERIAEQGFADPFPASIAPSSKPAAAAPAEERVASCSCPCNHHG